MSKRCILVSFPRFPYTLETLLPDSLLAAIAGTLADGGHRPLILDYGTMDTLRRFLPTQMRRVSMSFAGQLLCDRSPASHKAFAAISRLRGLSGFHRRRKDKLSLDLAIEAAQDLCSHGRSDLVIISIREAADAAGAVLLAKQLRVARPSVVIAAAGAFVEQYGELLARRAQVFDCLCLGDPEWTLTRLAEVVDRPELWAEVPNLAIVRAGDVRLTRRKRIDLNSLALPDFSTDVYPALEDDGKFKVLGVTCTRVCSHHCPACPHGEIQPGLSRPRIPKLVCEALTQAMRSQNVCTFALEGPAFPEDYAEGLAREMLSRGLAALYVRDASIRETRVANLATFKASGCQVLSFRADTGSQWLLEDYYDRGFGVSQCEKVLKSSVASQLLTIGRFTYPCPADDYHTRAETLRLLERVRPGSALVDLPDPAPGSEWFHRPEDFGFRLDMPAFVKAAIDGRGRLELPPRAWRALLNHRRQVSIYRAQRELETFRADIRCAGISTDVTPKLGLVARVSGYEGQENDFTAILQRKFVEGDLLGIADAAARFNRRASMPARRAAGAQLPALAAAGN